MSGNSSTLGRYLRRRVARKVIARVGAAKLAAIGAALLGCLLIFLVLLAAIVGGSASAQQPGSSSCTAAINKNAGAASPPQRLLPFYIQAAQKYRLGPRGAGILAAINYVESDFGRSPLPGVARGTTNYAGAAGPMQFLYPSSWDAFGVDGDGDGDKDVYDPADAIFAAANLLHAAGAPGNWYGAIFSYNHADWYVEKVERIATGIGTIQCTSQLGELPPPGVERLLYVAKWIEAQKIPYCWGGGHAEKPGPSGGEYCWSSGGTQIFGSPAQGLDCSGSVRWLLVLSGFPDPGPTVSGGFANPYPNQSEDEAPIWSSGRGAHVTVWSNAVHVFIEIDGVVWGTSESNFAHGPGFAEHGTDGFTPSHPVGL